MFQIDLHLPPDSEFLFARIRVINPHDRVLPMYWWTNMGVDERPERRYLAPAATAFKFTKLVDIPVLDGVDFLLEAAVVAAVAGMPVVAASVAPVPFAAAPVAAVSVATPSATTGARRPGSSRGSRRCSSQSRTGGSASPPPRSWQP